VLRKRVTRPGLRSIAATEESSIGTLCIDKEASELLRIVISGVVTMRDVERWQHDITQHHARYAVRVGSCNFPIRPRAGDRGREAIDVLACYCTTGAEKVLLLSAAELVFAQRISALFAGFASRGHFDFDLHARIG
jgi:hypothetical protein